jgi:hypothetical protein
LGAAGKTMKEEEERPFTLRQRFLSGGW